MKRSLMLRNWAVLSPLAAEKSPEPIDTSAAVHPHYSSAFAGYVRYRDELVASWRESNEKLLRQGVHGAMGHGSMHGNASADSAAKNQSTGQLMRHPSHGM